MKSHLEFLVALLSCVMTFFLARQVLRQKLNIGPPTLLAAALSLLAFLGLKADESSASLLIPSAALALALLIMRLVPWLLYCNRCRFIRRHSRDAVSPRASGFNRLACAGKLLISGAATQPRQTHPRWPGPKDDPKQTPSLFTDHKLDRTDRHAEQDSLSR